MKRFLLLSMICILIPLVFAETKSIDINVAQITSSSANDVFLTYTLEGTWFNWGYSEENVCSVWSLDSIKAKCYGSQQCCVFASDLDSSSESWKVDFSITADKARTISAQVIYLNYTGIDYTLTSDSASDVFPEIVESNIKYLTIPKLAKSVSLTGSQSNQKTITLNIYHGNQSKLRVGILLPINNSFYSQADDLSFDYFVYHDSNSQVSCNLLMDNSNIMQIDNSSQLSQKIASGITINEGFHKFKLSCRDSINQQDSPETVIIADYTPPSVTLLTDNGTLSLTNYITLNFTATDNFADLLECKLLLNGNVSNSYILRNGAVQTASLNNLDNGTMIWNVICNDKILNQKTSESRYFTVETNHEFSFEPNKIEFSIGELGYFLIMGPYGATTNLLITDPKGSSYYRYYKDGIYPVFSEINYTNIPGTYNVDAVMIYKGAYKKITSTITVKNSFLSEINMNKNIAAPLQEIKFEANTQGGIDAKTFKWDFGDTSTSTEKAVTKKYDKIGTYEINLVATDSVGNTARSRTSINIVNLRKFDVEIRNIAKEIVPDASIFIDGERKQSDSNGQASFFVLEGKRKVIIIKDNYIPINEEMEITQDTVKTYYIENLFTLNLSSRNFSSSTQNQGTPPDAENSDQPSQTDVTNTNVGNENEIYDNSSRASALLNDITTEIENSANLDSATQDAYDTMGVDDSLQEAKKTLLRLQRDLDGLKFLRDSSVADQRRIEIDSSLDKISHETIKSLNVKSTEEYTVYPEKKDMQTVIGKYAEKYKIDKQKTKDFIDANVALQRSFILAKTIRIVEIEYLDGKKETITLIDGRFRIKKSNDRNETLFILESIPKELATSSDDMVFITPNQILEKDPIIMYDASKVDKMTYYIKKELDIDSTKKTVSVLLNPLPEAIKKPGIDITGFAIFSSITGVDDPMLLLQIGVVVLLLLIYVIYEFEILVKIKKYDIVKKINPVTYFSAAMNKEMKELHDLIKKAEEQINKDELDAAENTYQELIKIYNDKIKSEDRKKVIDKISSIYNELIVHRILAKIKKIDEMLAKNEKKSAREAYNDVKELYSQLPPTWKQKVGTQCKEIFERIAKPS